MSLDHSLQAAYEEWRQIVTEEGIAIGDRNWAEIEHCRNRLRAVQARIVRCSALVHQEWAQKGRDPKEEESRLQAIVNELIELERQNVERLNAIVEARIKSGRND